MEIMLELINAAIDIKISYKANKGRLFNKHKLKSRYKKLKNMVDKYLSTNRIEFDEIYDYLNTVHEVTRLYGYGHCIKFSYSEKFWYNVKYSMIGANFQFDLNKENGDKGIVNIVVQDSNPDAINIQYAVIRKGLVISKTVVYKHNISVLDDDINLDYQYTDADIVCQNMFGKMLHEDMERFLYENAIKPLEDLLK